MARSRIVQMIVTTAVMCAPLAVTAQPRHGAGGAAPAAQPAGDEGAMTFSTDEAAQPTQPEGAQPATTGTGGDALGALTVPGGEVTAQRHRLVEDISAVQQIYALRNHRFEINPSANFALNDQYVQHTGFGLTLNYWISNVLSVGLTGVWFQGLNAVSDVNRYVGRSTGLVVPINEYQFAAALNFSYVPLYGKFSMFNRFIFHWDLYATAGVGVMSTRPIPNIDPEVRTFDWGMRILFDLGIGVRVFVSRSVAINAELRNFIYPELLENTRTNYQETDGRSLTCNNCRRNPANWTADSSLTDNVMLSVGLTIFLPFSFTYHLPK